VTGRARAALAATGAVAVDMESAWLAAAAADPDRPLAVVRAVLDGPGRELADPRPALRALRAAAPVLAEWAAATGPRTVLLGAPRAFCAGVERAVEAVGLALEREGAPVHVRGQIVHNRHVVAGLERRGARFVREVDEVPPGAPVVLSAHGVAPSVRAAAAARGLRVIDATCPLVAKVHAEARRFADAGYTVLLVGHAGHEEVVGTLGEAPETIRLVQDAADAERVEVADPQRVAYVTQTTLAVDETADVVAILRRRFPALVGPRREDICYATQNRQQAVKTLAGACDAVLVVGSANSSNSNRLVEVAERHGARARLVEDETALDLGWLAGARTLGVTAGASAPEALVQRVLGALRGLGPLDIREHAVARETARFKIPAGGR
jgi:4-hydroxy-3-methylbut-2-enyl diphosphate reductase